MSDQSLIPSGEPLPGEYEALDRNEIHARLKVYIADLLDHNFDKLCNMMYRHDVPESRFHAALEAGSTDSSADLLADIVIERELQKMETRRAYRKSKTDKEKKQIDE